MSQYKTLSFKAQSVTLVEIFVGTFLLVVDGQEIHNVRSYNIQSRCDELINVEVEIIDKESVAS